MNRRQAGGKGGRPWDLASLRPACPAGGYFGGFTPEPPGYLEIKDQSRSLCIGSPDKRRSVADGEELNGARAVFLRQRQNGGVYCLPTRPKEAMQADMIEQIDGS